MKMLLQRIERNGKKAPLPEYATSGSAGLDLTAFIEEPITLTHGAPTLIKTGIAVAVPEGYVGLLFARSGLGIKHGVTLSNGVGVIDSDYRGEIGVGLCSISEKEYTVSPGDRIAQLVIVPIVCPTLEEADSLPETDRGAGGFGSTGR